jgi:hypothetical protein
MVEERRGVEKHFFMGEDFLKDYDTKIEGVKGI